MCKKLKKLNLFLFAVLMIGMLAGCVQKVSESGNYPDSTGNSAESKKQLEESLVVLEELGNVLNSLDTVRDQDLITP